MTVSEEKQNFISHYLEDWIPAIKMSETVKAFEELITNYCRQQRENCARDMAEIYKNGNFNEAYATILNTKQPI